MTGTLGTSEFWLGLLAVVMAFVVSQHVLTNEQAKVVSEGIIALVAVISQRVVHKVITGNTPFLPKKVGVGK